jgi:hypothetical protein
MNLCAELGGNSHRSYQCVLTLTLESEENAISQGRSNFVFEMTSCSVSFRGRQKPTPLGSRTLELGYTSQSKCARLVGSRGLQQGILPL